ncbi:MAG TPA: hypothetical protein VKB38_05700 [Terracidiphilus sp.]|nr:hypothetical protein [Terracidiphilus sp.]
MRSALIALLLASCAVSVPAEFPDAPIAAPAAAPSASDPAAAFVRRAGTEQVPPRRVSAWLIAGFALDGAARGLDAYSTHRALEDTNNHEMILPGAIVRSQPALYASGVSIVLAEYVGCRLLTAHHRERLARWVPYVDVAAVLPFAVHNLSLPHRNAAN